MTYDIISRRTRKTIKIKTPDDIFECLKRYADKQQEYFIVITLNSGHEVISVHIATIGLVNKTIIHPREVFKHAYIDNAVSIVVAHNHPSGSLKPSSEDIEIMQRLNKAAEILGIPLIDHLIINKEGYFSFRQEKLVFKSL